MRYITTGSPTDYFQIVAVAMTQTDCGVSEAAPYRHFADKDSLLSAIISQAYEKFDEALKGAVLELRAA